MGPVVPLLAHQQPALITTLCHVPRGCSEIIRRADLTSQQIIFFVVEIQVESTTRADEDRKQIGFQYSTPSRVVGAELVSFLWPQPINALSNAAAFPDIKTTHAEQHFGAQVTSAAVTCFHRSPTTRVEAAKAEWWHSLGGAQILEMENWQQENANSATAKEIRCFILELMRLSCWQAHPFGGQPLTAKRRVWKSPASAVLFETKAPSRRFDKWAV
ncbi:hypothetical protein LA080_002061 [Diaporthe eres]|nr:hypothetical protein LA080_002061 [Diaporthe eres]